MSETRKVIGINVESGEEKVFSSVSAACKKTQIKRSRIIECLKGIRKSTGGYIWQYI